MIGSQRRFNTKMAQQFFTHPRILASDGACCFHRLKRPRGNIPQIANWRCHNIQRSAAPIMIFFIVLGAQLFNTFLAFTQTPQALAEWVGSQGYQPMLVLLLILACYLVFGCVMDSLSMILLTIQIFFPIIESLDFGMSSEMTAIWFGILALVVVEVGLITPPVGMNLFIIQSMARDIPIQRTYVGVLPFLISDMVRVALLIAVPSLSLWLVERMF